MRKSELLLDIAQELGVKGKISVPEGLWGYGKISYNEAKCIGCGKCEENCTEKTITFERIFDLPRAFKAKDNGSDLKKDRILSLIRSLAQKKPENSIPVPDLVEGYGNVKIDEDKCIGCGNCERYCTGEALKVEKVLEIGGGK